MSKEESFASSRGSVFCRDTYIQAILEKEVHSILDFFRSIHIPRSDAAIDVERPISFPFEPFDPENTRCSFRL
jgi:hypothetical protein